MREIGRCHAAGFEDGERDHELRNAGAFYKLEGKEIDSLLEPAEAT